MKNIFIVSSLLFIVCTFYSCSSNKVDETDDGKQALIAQIDSIQKKMFDKKTMEMDKNLAFKGITAYHDFVKKFPDDSIHSAEYLFRMADLCKGVGDYGKAINTFNQICKTYPKYKKIPECIFLQGYYYQEFFKDTNSAKTFYNELISKYPAHPFSDDAKAMMKNFGKTDEQLIKEFEEKNAVKKK